MTVPTALVAISSTETCTPALPPYVPGTCTTPTVCPPIMPMPPADPVVTMAPQVVPLIARTVRNTHACLFFILYLPVRNPFIRLAADSIQADQLHVRGDRDAKTACRTTAILRCRSQRADRLTW
jgi:hypothetical protein